VGALVKALARALRWQPMLDDGVYATVSEIGDAENISKSYGCRLLPLTCLAPDIVGAILEGQQPKGLRLAEVLGNGPLDWDEQRVSWRSGSPRSCFPSSPVVTPTPARSATLDPMARAG
jgi:hypothetical protein